MRRRLTAEELNAIPRRTLPVLPRPPLAAGQVFSLRGEDCLKNDRGLIPVMLPVVILHVEDAIDGIPARVRYAPIHAFQTDAASDDLFLTREDAVLTPGIDACCVACWATRWTLVSSLDDCHGQVSSETLANIMDLAVGGTGVTVPTVGSEITDPADDRLEWRDWYMDILNHYPPDANLGADDDDDDRSDWE